MAVDRKKLGQSLVKGPFAAIYPGGLSSATSFYDRHSAVYYPFDLDGAKALLEKAGLKDTDGNGFVNFPADKAGGKDVEIVLLVNTDYTTDKNLAEGVVGQMEKLGIRVDSQFARRQAARQQHVCGQAGTGWCIATRRNSPRWCRTRRSLPPRARAPHGSTGHPKAVRST